MDRLLGQRGAAWWLVAGGWRGLPAGVPGFPSTWAAFASAKDGSWFQKAPNDTVTVAADSPREFSLLALPELISPS